jgi:hypothetical protein
MPSKTPHKGGCDGVIPHRSDQHAAETGPPPNVGAAIDKDRKPDIGDGANRTNQIETDQAGQKAPARKPLVALGEKIVEGANVESDHVLVTPCEYRQNTA